MQLSQKRTCKDCKLSCLSNSVTHCAAGAELDKSFIRADIPKEPCFKPKTNGDMRDYYRSYDRIMRASLEIYRLKQRGLDEDD